MPTVPRTMNSPAGGESSMTISIRSGESVIYEETLFMTKRNTDPQTPAKKYYIDLSQLSEQAELTFIVEAGLDRKTTRWGIDWGNPTILIER